MTDTPHGDTAITSSKVSQDHRATILPKYFPHTFVVVENMVYRFVEQLCEHYSGECWEFYELSNGGFYMALNMEGLFHVSVPYGARFEGEISADALGIIVCLSVYSHLAGKHPCSDFGEHYWSLRDFAAQHKEMAAIIKAIA